MSPARGKLWISKRFGKGNRTHIRNLALARYSCKLFELEARGMFLPLRWRSFRIRFCAPRENRQKYRIFCIICFSNLARGAGWGGTNKRCYVGIVRGRIPEGQRTDVNEKMRKCAFCRTHFLAKHIPTAAAIWKKVKGNGPMDDSQPSAGDLQCPNDDFSLWEGGSVVP